MRRTLTVVALIVLTASACGGSTPAGRPGTTAAYTLTGTGPFEGGTDLPTGVYTAQGTGCSAETASSRTFDAASGSANEQDLIAVSVVVRDVARIAVRRGEYLRVVPGCHWKREDPAGPRTPDPATLSGGCTILLGDGLVNKSVAWLLDPARDRRTGSALQERLYAVVVSGAMARDRRSGALHDPAGSMVDFLDAPTYFVAGHKLKPPVIRAAAAIRKACRQD